MKNLFLTYQFFRGLQLIGHLFLSLHGRFVVFDVELVVLVNGEHANHGTYIRWQLNNYTHREQSLLFELFKAFDYIGSRNRCVCKEQSVLFDLFTAFD